MNVNKTDVLLFYSVHDAKTDICLLYLKKYSKIQTPLYLYFQNTVFS